jgi:hypothetical protein
MVKTYKTEAKLQMPNLVLEVLISIQKQKIGNQK